MANKVYNGQSARTPRVTVHLTRQYINTIDVSRAVSHIQQSLAMDTPTFSPNQHFCHHCIDGRPSSHSATCYCPSKLRKFTEEIYEAYGEASITRCTTQLKQMVDGDVFPKKLRDRFRPRVVRFQILREYPMILNEDCL